MTRFTEVVNGEVTLRVAMRGKGPVILCTHGWPELWYSWRHQMEYFSDPGYCVAAMDVRGYGSSSKPPEVAAYTINNLSSDVSAAISAISASPVVLFGRLDIDLLS